MRGLRQRPLRRRAGRGFSLIEILVAVLIVSVGVLGVAGLQLISLRNNTSAMLRTQAFQSAYEIIDRLRANPDQDYTITLAADPPVAQDCTNVDCTPVQMRDYDHATWLADIQAGLPNGDGSIAVDNTDPENPVINVTVQWQDDRGAGAQPLSVSVGTTL